MKHTKKLEDACKRRPVTNKWYQQYLSIVDDFSHADGQSAIDLMSLSSIVPSGIPICNQFMKI